MLPYDSYAEEFYRLEAMNGRWRARTWKTAAKSFWRLWKQTNDALTYMQERANEHLAIERAQRKELEKQRETINALTDAVLNLKATVNRLRNP